MAGKQKEKMASASAAAAGPRYVLQGPPAPPLSSFSLFQTAEVCGLWGKIMIFVPSTSFFFFLSPSCPLAAIFPSWFRQDANTVSSVENRAK